MPEDLRRADQKGACYLLGMPELPEVETVRRGIIELIGETSFLKKVELKRQDLRFPIPEDLVSRFRNVEILKIADRRIIHSLYFQKQG